MDISFISWVIALLPDSLVMWIFYGFAGIGFLLILVSWFIYFIPLINRYRWPVQVIGVLVFGLGAYLSGGYGTEMMWRARVAELQDKIKTAEEQSQKTNTIIQEKIVYRNRVIEKNTVQYVDRVREIAKEVDAQCKVDPRIVQAINQASEEPK